MAFVVVDSKDGSKGSKFSSFDRAKKELDRSEPVGRYHILDTTTKKTYRDDRTSFNARDQSVGYISDSGHYFSTKPGGSMKDRFNVWWQGS